MAKPARTSTPNESLGIKWASIVPLPLTEALSSLMSRAIGKAVSNSSRRHPQQLKHTSRLGCSSAGSSIALRETEIDVGKIPGSTDLHVDGGFESKTSVGDDGEIGADGEDSRNGKSGETGLEERDVTGANLADSGSLDIEHNIGSSGSSGEEAEIADGRGDDSSSEDETVFDVTVDVDISIDLEFEGAGGGDTRNSAVERGSDEVEALLGELDG